MDYYIAAFRSRSQTMRFHDALRYNRLPCGVISTPQGAMAGCGISVRFAPSDYPAARRLLAGFNLSSFIGFFRVTQNGRGQTVERL